MGCPHCAIEHDLEESGWCSDCERAFGVGARRRRRDTVQLVACAVVAGGVALTAVLIGGGFLSPLCAFPALWVIHSLSELHDRRRRLQSLDARLPRAYLASKT